MGEQWNGEDRRKKKRLGWQLGIPRNVSVGEIVGVMVAFSTAVGIVKEIQSTQERQEDQMRVIQCELRYIQDRLDGLNPTRCPVIEVKK